MLFIIVALIVHIVIHIVSEGRGTMLRISSSQGASLNEYPLEQSYNYCVKLCKYMCHCYIIVITIPSIQCNKSNHNSSYKLM